MSCPINLFGRADSDILKYASYKLRKSENNYRTWLQGKHWERF